MHAHLSRPAAAADDSAHEAQGVCCANLSQSRSSQTSPTHPPPPFSPISLLCSLQILHDSIHWAGQQAAAAEASAPSLRSRSRSSERMLRLHRTQSLTRQMPLLARSSCPEMLSEAPARKLPPHLLLWSPCTTAAPPGQPAWRGTSRGPGWTHSSLRIASCTPPPSLMPVLSSPCGQLRGRHWPLMLLSLS